jgi:serine/threonine protein kinase
LFGGLTIRGSPAALDIGFRTVKCVWRAAPGEGDFGVAMTSEQFQRVKELFAALQPLSAQERMRALEARCGDDTVVRSELEKLLKSNDGAARQSDGMSSPFRSGAREMAGQRVGPYEVVEILGQGGMGVVYLAHDTRLARKAALKAILPGAEDDAIPLERLRREARVLASLSHPNLATVYGLEESHGTLFLAMEYIEGKSLSQRLGRSAMPASEALFCCEQIAAGLEAAHEEGVIHRDLKPCNVMFTAEGTVKLLDFGLARELREKALTPAADAMTLTVTREGSVAGTPAYMSPEQARGDPLDRRTDIFSFGSILFRCLTGRPAFEGETVGEVINAILTLEPDWSKLPAKLPASVASILRRCLAKDVAGRYRHIGDVRLDLREAQEARAWELPDTAPTPGAVTGITCCHSPSFTGFPRVGSFCGPGHQTRASRAARPRGRCELLIPLRPAWREV